MFGFAHGAVFQTGFDSEGEVVGRALHIEGTDLVMEEGFLYLESDSLTVEGVDLELETQKELVGLGQTF